MKHDKNSRKTRPQPFAGRPVPEGVVDYKEIAMEIARINGIDEEEMDKIVTFMTDWWKARLEAYGETDFLGIGKLVVSDSPDVEFEFIPYPEEVRNLNHQIALQRLYGGKEGMIGKDTDKSGN